MLPYILLALGIFAAIVVVLVIVISMRPATFRLERSITIAAPPAVVFQQVNDFHNWNAWSPWEKLDPTMKKTYEGSPAGVGAIYAWTGNGKVGEGKMTILESRPTERVQIKLQFFKPFAATNTAEFTFTPAGDGTHVNWAMYGPCNFMSKAFQLFCNMDKMVGKDFDKGLSQMKVVAEAKSAA